MDPELHKSFYHNIHTIATAHQVYDSSTDNFASVHWYVILIRVTDVLYVYI